MSRFAATAPLPRLRPLDAYPVHIDGRDLISLPSIDRRRDLVSRGPQLSGQRLPDRRVVVHDEDPGRAQNDS